MCWNELKRKEINNMGKKANNICCEKCKHYCRVLDSMNHSHGYVCALWLDGIAGNADWFYPDVKCFEKDIRDEKIQNHSR